MGCSSDSPSEPPNDNKNPTIGWTFDKVAVGVNTDNTLTVTVDDPDGDAVTVTWTVSAGQLNDPQGNPSMGWSAPNAHASVSVTAVANDGKGGSAQVSETILVGTVRSTSFANSTTLLASQSPYIFEPSSTVMAIIGGATVTVEAGVDIYMKPAAELQVEGNLLCNGTSSQPIRIKPNTRTLDEGAWAGLRGTTSGSIDLTRTEIEYAKEGVLGLNATTVLLTGCKITFSEQSAVRFQSDGELRVEDCTITNNRGSGILIEGGFAGRMPSQVTIRGDSIAFNGRFADSVEYTEEAGIAVNIADPAGALPFVIANNEISRNDYTGIRIGDPNNTLNHPAYPAISGNGIFGNEFRKSSKAQVILEVPFGTITDQHVDARNNFWGQAFPAPADSSQIKQGIIDRGDNVGILAFVVVYPWLNDWP